MSQTWQKACDCKGATATSACAPGTLERADFDCVSDVDFDFKAIPTPPPNIPPVDTPPSAPVT